MKKLFLVFILISVSLFSQYNPYFSLKLSYNADYTSTSPSYSMNNEFYVNASILTRNFSVDMSLGNSGITSAYIESNLFNYKLKFFKDRYFGSSEDYLGLYTSSDDKLGKGNGMELTFEDSLKFVFFQTQNLYYLKYKSSLFNLIFGKLDKDWNFEIDGNLSFQKSNLIFEIIQTSSLGLESGIFMTGLVSSDWKQGAKFIYKGDKVKAPYISGISNDSTFLINLWGEMKFFKLWSNIDIEKFVDNTEIGANLNFGNFGMNFYKKSLDLKDPFNPQSWGNFSFSAWTTFDFMNVKGKLSYSFGNPAHNAVGTIGEVYYLELSKTFGKYTFFTKYQKIVGIYEVRHTFYSEISVSGISSGSLKFWWGNGDFENQITFQNKIGVEFNTWF